MQENRSILIVEDERIVAEDLREVLLHLGYTVPAMVVSGEDAIEKAGIHHPDLVLMDIYLAGKINGIEAARRIRSEFGTPVIYITAYANQEIMAQAKITEPYGYILKPYDERELHSIIEIALYKHALDKKLRESEERYRNFVENFQGIAFRRDLDYAPVFLHGAVADITGYQEEDFTRENLKWLDIVGPADQERVRATCNNLRDMPGLEITREYSIVRKNGDLRWVCEHIRHVKATHEHESYIQGTMHDITDRVLAIEGIKRRDAILLAVGFAVEWFFRVPLLERSDINNSCFSSFEDVTPLLEQVGNAVNIDRIAMYQQEFEPGGSPAISMLYEWVSPGSPAYLHNPRYNRILYKNEPFSYWEKTLGEGRHIAGNLSEFQSREKEYLSPLGYESYLILPVIRKETFWGILTLSTKKPRKWLPEEIEGIRIVANVLAMVIGCREQAGFQKVSVPGKNEPVT